jgi:hypothetical protein
MVNTLIAALIMALVIGVVFWAVQSMMDIVPMNDVFRRLVHIIMILLVLIIGYNIVIVPVLGVLGVHVPVLFK